MDKINLLYLTSVLNKRGAERMLLQLAKRLDRQKYNVKVICLRKETPFMDEFIKEGIDIRSLNMTRYFQIGPLRSLYRLIKEEGIQVIHTHLYRDAIYGRVLGKKAGASVVISTLHNSYVWRPKLQLILDRMTSFWADKIVAVSDAVKMFAIEKEHMSTPKMMTIYNGIETEKYAPQPGINQKLREELGFSKNDFIIGNVGELTEQKGHCFLLDAAPIVLKARPDIRFVVVGDGDQKEKLKAQLSNLELHDRFHFLGFRSDIPQVLNLFDMFVLPSRWEGLPVVLIEAMAAGRAIIATDVDGNKEVIGIDEAGILVPPEDPKKLADAIINLAEDKEKREMLGKKGQERAEKIFDIRIMINRYERLYEECLGR